MKTVIKTMHEEVFSDKSKLLGILVNSSLLDDWKESFVYMFRETEESGGRYMFFNTMFDMWSYLLYSENMMKTACMSEEDFDGYYDAPSIEGSFGEKLMWV